MIKFLITLVLIAVSLGLSSVAGAELIYLSTTTEATLGGLTFEADDLALYNSSTGTATLFFDHSNFSANEDIDAVSVLSNGNLILSTEAGATLGGLDFVSGDLVEYNSATDSATLFFDHNLFSGTEYVDAACVRNGNIILSTTTRATLGGLTFEAEDLALYNPGTDISTLFFDHSNFSGNEDIDAVSVLGNGNIVLSTEAGATLGGLTFTSGDLVEYNTGTGSATLFFDHELFEGSFVENIDAVSVVPIPGAIWLLGTGLIGLVGFRKRPC